MTRNLTIASACVLALGLMLAAPSISEASHPRRGNVGFGFYSTPRGGVGVYYGRGGIAPYAPGFRAAPVYRSPYWRGGYNVRPGFDMRRGYVQPWRVNPYRPWR